MEHCNAESYNAGVDMLGVVILSFAMLSLVICVL
jgi:hypothetical protein